MYIKIFLNNIMKYIKSKKGYYYKIYKNGKKIRISKIEYIKQKNFKKK